MPNRYTQTRIDKEKEPLSAVRPTAAGASDQDDDVDVSIDQGDIYLSREMRFTSYADAFVAGFVFACVAIFCILFALVLLKN